MDNHNLESKIGKMFNNQTIKRLKKCGIALSLIVGTMNPYLTLAQKPLPEKKEIGIKSASYQSFNCKATQFLGDACTAIFIGEFSNGTEFCFRDGRSIGGRDHNPPLDNQPDYFSTTKKDGKTLKTLSHTGKDANQYETFYISTRNKFIKKYTDRFLVLTKEGRVTTYQNKKNNEKNITANITDDDGTAYQAIDKGSDGITDVFRVQKNGNGILNIDKDPTTKGLIKDLTNQAVNYKIEKTNELNDLLR